MMTIFSRHRATVSLFLIGLIGQACTTPVQSGPVEPDITTTSAPMPPVPPSSAIKIGLILDTSNSMDGLISQAQSQLWKIVNELAGATMEGEKPELQFALYEYGNSGLPASEGYIRMVTPLTTDLDQLSADLFSLTTNGGEEFCGHVIRSATQDLDWNEGNSNLKLIFIAGNEPFTQGNVEPNAVCSMAKEMGITINTIFCGDFQEGVRTGWKTGADLAEGHYMNIDQDNKTVYIATPYDHQIDSLNTLFNATYIPYGRLGQSKKQMQLSEDENSEKYGLANKTDRVLSKNSMAYKNETWDLVDASKKSDFNVGKIDSDRLPEEMKNMTDAEKLAYIEKKKKERADITRQISDLNLKRQAYIASERKKLGDDTKNNLDYAMLEAIRKQATTKGFSFDPK